MEQARDDAKYEEVFAHQREEMRTKRANDRRNSEEGNADAKRRRVDGVSDSDDIENLKRQLPAG